MRGLMIWIFGSAVAFFVTAMAFLLLANLGSNASERSLEPGEPVSRPRLPLGIELDHSQLHSLKPRPDQELSVVVTNQGKSGFSKANVTLQVSSEDTRMSSPRYYQARVGKLGAGESKTVRFTLDLSSLDGPEAEDPSLPEDSGRGRSLLEIQATTPEGVSTVKTAVLPSPEEGST
ncbi:MAG: hypothetical protein ACFB50_18175 [Rubrobacteraceae bacterium]